MSRPYVLQLRDDHYTRALQAGVHFHHRYEAYVSNGYDRLDGFLRATRLSNGQTYRVERKRPTRERRLYDRDCYKGAGL